MFNNEPIVEMDYDPAAKASILANESLMEQIRDLQFSQEGAGKLGYVDIAVEALADKERQSSLINKLFESIKKNCGVDFGKIPDSRGNLSSYVYYDQLYDCMQLINRITEGKYTENIAMMFKLHDILLAARSDFSWGFKVDNYFITQTYNTLVMSLYELLNISTVDATKHLRDKLNMKMPNQNTRIPAITKAVKAFIKEYESGHWRQMIKTFQTTSVGSMDSFINPADNSTAMEPANEGVIENTTKLVSAVNTLFGKGVDPNSESFKDSPAGIVAGTAVQSGGIGAFFKNHPILATAGSIAAIIGIFFAIRGITQWIASKTTSLKDDLRTNADILRKAIAIENNPEDDSVTKQKKMLDALDKHADVLEYKVLKTEKAYTKKAIEENRADFSKTDLRKITGADFSL